MSDRHPRRRIRYIRDGASREIVTLASMADRAISVLMARGLPISVVEDCAPTDVTWTPALEDAAA